MKHRYLVLFAGLLTGLALMGMWASRANAGGWAVISLESLPEGAVPGQPFTVRFTVLQHGISPMEGLEPQIQVEHAELRTRLTFEALPAAEAGVYEASLTLPEAGMWEWSIAAFSMVQPMPPLLIEPGLAIPAVPAGQTARLPVLSILAGLTAAALFAAALFMRRLPPARLAPFLMITAVLLLVLAGLGATRTSANEARPPVPEQIEPTIDKGDALFTSKGCVTCHTHSRASIPAEFPINSGPDLTRSSLGADYIRLWLNDPQAVKPATEMPNLQLTEDEIEALVTFLTSPAVR